MNTPFVKTTKSRLHPKRVLTFPQGSRRDFTYLGEPTDALSESTDELLRETFIALSFHYS